jgi:nitroreductase
MNDVLTAIRGRRSVRRYKDELLSRAELELIVEAGTWAPSGHNQQCWHFAVVQDRALLAEVNAKAKAAMAHIDVDWIRQMGEDEALDITHGAPALIVVSCTAGAVSGPTDCVAAMENMMLAAHSIGVGSCWMGLAGFTFDDTALMSALGVPEGCRPQQAAVFGRPAEDTQAPARKPAPATYTGRF